MNTIQQASAQRIAELQAALAQEQEKLARVSIIPEDKQLAIALHEREYHHSGVTDYGWDYEVTEVDGVRAANWDGFEHQRWLTKAREALAVADLDVVLKLAVIL